MCLEGWICVGIDLLSAVCLSNRGIISLPFDFSDGHFSGNPQHPMHLGNR